MVVSFFYTITNFYKNHSVFCCISRSISHLLPISIKMYLVCIKKHFLIYSKDVVALDRRKIEIFFEKQQHFLIYNIVTRVVIKCELLLEDERS